MKGNGLFGAIRAFFVYSGDEAGTGLTGVARYLQEHIEPKPVQNLRSEAMTGVARYLQESTDSEPVAESQPEAETGVARYLDKSIATEASSSDVEYQQQEVEIVQERLVAEDEQATEMLATGVAKYMQEQTVIESELPLVTGVEMYLQDQDVAAIARFSSTGVDEYVNQADMQKEAAAIIAKYQQQGEVKIESLKVTGVASYIDANIINSEGEGATGVVDYLDRADKKVEAEAIIAGYLERQQALADADLSAQSSSVSRYIEEREQDAANEVESGVTAYLEKDIKDADCADIIARFHEQEQLASEQQDALKPIENRVSVVKIRHRQPSSVARYINELDLETTPLASALSGVDKFMIDQELAAKEQEAAEIIAHFEARQLELQEQQTISGVARYIKDLAATEVVISGESSVSRYLVNRPAITVEIPALETSVSRYLDEKVVTGKESRAPTGVAHYLTNRLIEASQTPVETFSGVDRYLLSQG